MMRRWFQHLLTTPLALRRCFPPATLAAVDAAIAASERHHRAEIRCAVETTLSAGHLYRGVGSTQRAAEVFSELGMWDTAENNGILLYVLLAERTIEIVADRGFALRVTAAEWARICAGMEVALGAGLYRQGTLAAIGRITALAAEHFPAGSGDRNELEDRTILL